MAQETPRHKKRVVYTVPGVDAIEVRRDLVYSQRGGDDLRLDAYLPDGTGPGSRLPGVLFVHGGPVPPERGSVKDFGQYRSWGALVAASGLPGFTFNHHYNAPQQLEQSIADVRSAIDFVRQEAGSFGLDSERFCLWACSGGGPHICFALRERPSYVRCLVLYYTVLDLRPIDWLVEALGEETAARHSPVACIEEQRPPFPVFVGRAGLDHPGLNQTIDNFVAEALGVNATLELMNHPEGEHGFDIATDDARSRQIVARTLAFMNENV